MARLQILALALFAADGLSNLGSVQVLPERGTKKTKGTSDKTLPDVNELLPSRSFSAMKVTVAELEKRLAQEQQHSVTALQSTKSGYERTLLMQEKNNSQLARANLLISSRVQARQKLNAALRHRASTLVETNAILKQELEELNSNLSLARDFVQEGLVTSSTNESDVHVLAELAELDEKAHSASRKEAILGQFSSSARKLSLIESVSDANERSSDDIMNSLTSSLAHLASDANASQMVLKDAFDKKLSEAIRKYDELMRDQALMNKTQDDVEDLHKRLSMAVVHLSNVHDSLVARTRAIRAFAFRLGNPATGEAMLRDQSQEKSAVIHERAKPHRSGRHAKNVSRSVSSQPH